MFDSLQLVQHPDLRQKRKFLAIQNRDAQVISSAGMALPRLRESISASADCSLTPAHNTNPCAAKACRRFPARFVQSQSETCTSIGFTRNP